MKFYFSLQLKIIYRKFKDYGINPFLGLFLGGSFFYLVCNYLYVETAYAAYILGLIYLSVIVPLSDHNRNDFLKSIFTNYNHIKIRVIENISIALPFLFIYVIYSNYALAFGILGAALLASTLKFKFKFNLVISTPFRGTSFEFMIGLRKTYPLILVVYVLSLISIQVDNINLGLFTIVIISIISISYYNKPEDIFYVWNNSRLPYQFLRHKLKTASSSFFRLLAPVIIFLLPIYYSNYDLLFLFTLLGLLFLWLMVIIKYANFPDKLGLREGVLFTLCIYFPPFLIVIAPFYYKIALKNLKPILND